MKSIQSKLILLILVSIAVSILLTGGIGLFSSQNVIDSNSVKLINSISGEKAEKLNNTLSRVEQTVHILSQYTVKNLESIDKISNDDTYRSEYIKLLDELVVTCAYETDGAVSAYIRFNPEITPPKAGLFRVKNSETGEFEEHWITDLSEYDIDDVEYAGWYYIPVNEGKPVWLEPYYNRNTDMYMISYVVPVYFEDTFLGVVGMDIDFTYITDIVDSITVYNSGYAFLIDTNYNIVHHRELAAGTSDSQFSSIFNTESTVTVNSDRLFEYTYNGINKKAAFSMLRNGMCLAVNAPASEIDESKNDLFDSIILIAFIIMGVFFLITSSITRSIVSPLKALDKAAREIAKGNLNVHLPKKTKDEVGTLTESLGETAKQLKIRIDYINKLAYTDKLTEVNNNTAYINMVTAINKELEDKAVLFSVIVVDVNGLKYINDNFGHDSGNYLIITASDMLSSVFGRANVYRTGGDEFAVILKNVGRAECFELEEKFNKALLEQDGEIILSAAIGTATYDQKVDKDFETVYKRADLVMYTHKTDMKAKGMTSIMNK